MEFYTVLGTNQTPKKLRSLGESHDYYCYFPPPLPEFIVVFCLQWPETSKEKVSVQLFLDSDERNICRTIGEISKENSAFTFKGDWSEDEKSVAEEIQDKGRLLKLLVAPFNQFNETDSQDSGISGETISALEAELSPLKKVNRDQTNRNKKNGGTLFESSFVEKKQVHKSAGSVKRKSVFDFVDEENVDRKKQLKCGVLKDTRNVKENFQHNNDLVTPTKRNSSKSPSCGKKNVSNNKIVTKSPSTPGLFDLKEPSPRWGHTFSEVADGTAFLIGGQGIRNQICKDSIWQFNFETNVFQRIEDCNDASRRMGHTATYSEALSRIYVFGGSKNKRWFNDIHALDLNTMSWRRIEPTGKGPVRAYHSCTLVYDELLVFGGVYPNPDPMPDGCSNEVFFFNTDSNGWYQPIVSGEKPNPRSGHSVCFVDGLLYLFGGWDAPTCFNDLWTLDIGLMSFAKVEVTGEAPPPRSWHGAALTSDQQNIVVYGGYNGEAALSDVHLFKIASKCWTQIETEGLVPRAGHKLMTCRRNRKGRKKEDCIIVFGGGDNEGGFYNDLAEVPFPVPGNKFFARP